MAELETQTGTIHTSLIEFDDWVQLAKSDPAAFETRRARMIEQHICAMPEHKQQRLRCLQWKIDQVRNQCKTPMAACLKLSEMMWDSLVGPGGLKDALEQLSEDSPAPLPRARIMEFPAAPRS
jgi:hypothetical protein